MRIRGYARAQRRSWRRPVLAAAGLSLIAGLLPVMAGIVPGTTAVAARADDITASQNLLRNGWDSNEPGLSPAAVSTFSSAPRWSSAVDGPVYAQPLVLGSTVIVGTDSDWVYGFDAGTGAVKWSTRLGSAYPIVSDPVFKGCTDLVPNVGVVGTPAYDSATGDIFFFANIMNGKNPAYYMVQMNPASGAVVKKIQITGRPSNNPNIGFSARYNLERPGVLVLDGAVYGAFASHCDTKPYTGYVARVNIATGAETLWSPESGVTNNQAGIWQSGAGLMSDGPGRIFLTSGNGVSPTKHAGTSPGGQLAESVIRLAVNSNATLGAQDFFSPANAPSLDASDVDYGAGGPVGVPFSVAGYNTLAQIGKDGRIWLLNRSGLGGREQGPNSTDNPLFVGKAYGGEWGHPAIFGDTAATQANAGTTNADNDFLISVGKDDVMRVFRFAVTSANKPWLTNVANSSLTYGYTSGSPVVTSSGDDPTSAVIWEVYTPNTAEKTGAGSILEAYQLGNVASSTTTPSPCNSAKPCTLQNIWSSQPFASAKFSIPATSQGWVYVGTRDGHVLAFSAPGAAAPAAASSATLPQAAVGATSTRTVTITAKKPVTFTGATASTVASNATAATSEFGVGQVSEIKKGSSTAVPVQFPVTLKKGDKLSVRASFTPTVPGGSSGTLSLRTNSAAFPIVAVPISAEGTKDGLYAQPAAQTFPLAPNQHVIPVPIGIQKPEIVNISNFGMKVERVRKVIRPSKPFSATNLPAVGAKIYPGETISVQVTYAPTSPGPATGSFTVVGSSGQKAVVRLSAVGTPAVSQLTASQPSVNFGNIPVGKKATAYIQVSNTGNTQSTVNGVAAVATPFAAPLKPAAGLPFNPESDLSLPVTFTPSKKGTFSTRYKLTWMDVNGTHTLTVTLRGTAT
ncbi:MAG TPA: choice-of-anchor D domain-containing protein [Streptosporangiaceae bacterium]|nr:choice-of-anchor D domain-containing protein [Streptosporangiaceae bacterium]